MWWLINYRWIRDSSAHYYYSDAITHKHPAEWLYEMRKEQSERYTIVSAIPIKTHEVTVSIEELQGYIG